MHKICTEENKHFFSLETIKSFTNFFSKIFFRNYKLYQTVFQMHQNEYIKERLIAVQTPLIPEPLSFGVIKDKD